MNQCEDQTRIGFNHSCCSAAHHHIYISEMRKLILPNHYPDIVLLSNKKKLTHITLFSGFVADAELILWDPVFGQVARVANFIHIYNHNLQWLQGNLEGYRHSCWGTDQGIWVSEGGHGRHTAHCGLPHP